MNTSSTQPRVIILHGHMFKNAGTTFDWCLRRNFGDRFYEHHQDKLMRRGGTSYLAQFLTDNTGIIALSSHHLCYPVPLLANTVVLPVYILRDPIERIHSVYHFERKQKAETLGAISAKKMNFLEYVQWRMQPDVPPTIREFQTRFCSGYLDKFGVPVNEEIYQEAVTTIEQTPLVGVVDRFDETMVVFEQVLKPYFPEIDLSYISQNTNLRFKKLEPHQKREKVIAELGSYADQVLDENRYDNQLYKYAHEVLNGRISEIEGFQGRVEDLRLRCSHLSRKNV